MEEHLEALLSLLEERTPQVREVCERFDAGIHVAQYFYEVNPQFFLTSEALRRVAELGLSLSFDQYCLGESDDS